MDDLDDFIAEHMKTYGQHLAWAERLTLVEQARSQSELSAEQFVLNRLLEIGTVWAA